MSAAYDTLRGRARGASTITQQLVRARLLPDSVLEGSTYDRKIKEIIQSIRLTEAYGEGDRGQAGDHQVYLNQNFYGNQSYGVAAAAKSYFGVTDLKKLTLAQMAILAAIPQSPSDYDLVRNADRQTDANGKTILVVPNDNPIVQRRNQVLDAMRRNRVLTPPGQRGAITDAQIDAAKKEQVILAPQSGQLARAALRVAGPQGARQDPLPAGPRRTATRSTPAATPSSRRSTGRCSRPPRNGSRRPSSGPTRRTPPPSSRRKGIRNLDWIQNLRGKNIHNGALVAIDYRTGKVLAYVGCASYYSRQEDQQFQPQFDVLADGWRQPGSAFKPINYITGFEDRTITRPRCSWTSRRTSAAATPDGRRQPRARPDFGCARRSSSPSTSPPSRRRSSTRRPRDGRRRSGSGSCSPRAITGGRPWPSARSRCTRRT